jgi:hypothetical protein
MDYVVQHKSQNFVLSLNMVFIELKTPKIFRRLQKSFFCAGGLDSQKITGTPKSTQQSFAPKAVYRKITILKFRFLTINVF